MPSIVKKRIACLASGSGSNFGAIIDSIERGEINGQIVCLIASNYDAFALTRAKAAGIETFVCALKDFGSDSFKRDEKILSILNSLNVDFVVLAGYLGITSDILCKAYKNRIINIHPALLPKFGGKGFYGLNVHKAVIDSGEKISGATVHFVDSGIDTGLIIASDTVEVLKGDTPETLQKRILDNVEHKLLCRVLRALCLDKVRIENDRVIIVD